MALINKTTREKIKLKTSIKKSSIIWLIILIKMEKEQLIESFIQCLKERPEIWNLKHPNHKNFSVVNEKWVEIMAFPTWNSKSWVQKKITFDAMVRRVCRVEIDSLLKKTMSLSLIKWWLKNVIRWNKSEEFWSWNKEENVILFDATLSTVWKSLKLLFGPNRSKVVCYKRRRFDETRLNCSTQMNRLSMKSLPI